MWLAFALALAQLFQRKTCRLILTRETPHAANAFINRSWNCVCNHRKPSAPEEHIGRRRAGLVVLPIEADPIALADVLIEARLIDPNMADDRTALAKATTRLIEIFCKEKNT